MNTLKATAASGNKVPKLAKTIGAGIISGALVGFAIWILSKTSGDERLLNLLCGWALLGAFLSVGAPTLIRAFRNSLRPLGVSTIQVGLPGLGVTTIALGDPQRAAARRILLEMTTRTVIQPLATDDGAIRASLDSLHGFFLAVREELKSMPATPPNADQTAKTLESIANEMLNAAIRPYTSRWHPRLDAWERAGFAEHDWPLAQQCRDDLAKMRKAAAFYAVVLGKAANILHLEELVPHAIRPTEAEVTAVLDGRPDDNLTKAIRKFDKASQGSLSPELREAAWRTSLDLFALSTILATNAPTEACVKIAWSASASLQHRLGTGVPGADPNRGELAIKSANATVAELIGQLAADALTNRQQTINKIDACAAELEAVARGGFVE